jgi:hypothetical protein
MLEELRLLKEEMFELEEILEEEDEKFLYQFFNMAELAGLRRDISRLRVKVAELKQRADVH